MSDREQFQDLATPLRMLRLPDVIYATGLSRSRIYDLESKGEFPKRRRLSSRATAWRSDEIQAWIESRPRGDETEAA